MFLQVLSGASNLAVLESSTAESVSRVPLIPEDTGLQLLDLSRIFTHSGGIVRTESKIPDTGRQGLFILGRVLGLAALRGPRTDSGRV